MADPAVTQPDSTTTFSLPKEVLDSYPSLSKFKDPVDLAKSYGEMEKMSGARLAVPKDDAKPEEWDTFYTKVGRPAKADDYRVEAPKFEGMEFKISEEQQKGYLTAAHAAGLTGKQAQALMNWWGDTTTKSMQGLVSETKTQDDALHKDWGDKYDDNLKLAQAGFKMFVGDGHKDLAGLLKQTGMDSHPAIIKFFKGLNDRLNEGKVVEAGSEGNVTEDEKTSIQGEIDKTRGEFEKLSRTERETQGAKYGTKLAALYAKLYPEG